MANTKDKHDEHTRIISLKPQIIGLENIVLCTGEANLFNNKGMMVRQPDNLAFDSSTKTLYNIEYKCHYSEIRDIHATYQVSECKKYLKDIFPEWHIKNILVYDNFKADWYK